MRISGEMLKEMIEYTVFAVSADETRVNLNGIQIERAEDDRLRMVATDGHRNACSFLYGCAWRAARALGYVRLVTYTLATEPGTSLRAAGWKAVHETKAERWTRPSRERTDDRPEQVKIRWEATA